MNVAEKLASEIRRVTKMRETYAFVDGMPNVNVKFALAGMDATLSAAVKAAGVDDALTQIAALKGLEEWSE